MRAEEKTHPSERELLGVVRGDEPDLLEHAGECSGRVGATREAEEADLISLEPVVC